MNHNHSKHQTCHPTNINHETHHEMVQDFKKRFWICFFLTIPILIISPMIQNIFHYSIKFYLDSYVEFFLSSFIFIYGGWPFLKGGYEELKNKNPGMMTLISMAILIAYVYSSAVVLGLKGTIFFWELVTLIDIMLLGHWIEMKSVLGASRSLEFLVKMLPSTAHLIKNSTINDVKIEELEIENIVLVKPSEQIPADGYVIEGIGYINESMLTGESIPVKKEMGNKVIGGSINGNSSIKIKISRLGKDSYLSKVINLVKEAQKVKSKTQKLADKAAKWLTFIAIFFGIITFFSWLLIYGDLGFSLERMVTVMVISCPHALGLAIPLVIAISTSLCAKLGLLIRNRTAFENSRKITTIIFDKTGTLTKGKFGVTKCYSLSKKYSSDELLKFTAAIEQHSEHPIATGIIDALKNEKIKLLEAKDVKNITGEGIEGRIENKNIKIVSFAYLKKNNISIPNLSLENSTTNVFILIDQQVEGYISLEDEIRPESFETIKQLKKNHIKTIMVTGDNEKVANKVYNELHLDQYYSNTLPHEKLQIVKELQKKGEFVAMTGDGVNDAPALAQADVGIAVGSGTDVAAETADIILVQSNPLDILALILFGKATYNKMIQNLIWATAYNVIAIPLAGGVLYSYGVIISPAFGAVLMSLSTVIVAINARLLSLNKGLKILQRKKGVIL